MAYYVAPISNGLGDLIVSIPILQSLIETGQPTYLIMRSPAQYGLSAHIEGLAGSFKESDFDSSKLGPGDTFYNFRNHPLQSDYIWGSKEFEEKFPGFGINDVLKGICKDWGINTDFEELKPLTFSKRFDCSDRIIFIPGSAGLFKCWPADYWIDLAQRLTADGHKILVIGQPERSKVVKEVLDRGLEHIVTPTLEDALNVISSSACAIAVDTGLMHLSVHQRIPTVALFRYNTMFLRPYNNVRNLVGPLCPVECLQREFEGAPNERLEFKVWQLWEPMTCALNDAEGHCMSKISAATVYDAVTELVAERV